MMGVFKARRRGHHHRARLWRRETGRGETIPDGAAGEFLHHEDEQVVLIDGIHHARELNTIEMVKDVAIALGELYGQHPLATAFVDNLEMTLAKSSLEIARGYLRLVPESDGRDRIWSAIAGEHDRAVAAVLAIVLLTWPFGSRPVLNGPITFTGSISNVSRISTSRHPCNNMLVVFLSRRCDASRMPGPRMRVFNAFSART